MDNLTHTLIGVLAGETAARASRPDPTGLPATTRRNLLVTLAALGSNLPDLDLLYSYVGSKVNYLSHHRGHTHTVLGVLLLGAATLALTSWWLRRRGLAASAADRRWLASILLFTPLLHLGMDYTNNYGVHPFWPFDNRWRYGDAVFIIEPLLWTACAPLALLLRTLTARALVGAVLVLGIAVSVFSGLVAIPALTLLAVLMVCMLMLARRLAPLAALASAIALWIAVTVTFLVAAQVAAERSQRVAATLFPQARLLDNVLTPLPANPLCWEMTLIQHEAGQLVLRRALLALTPAWIGPGACLRRGLDRPMTAPMEPLPAAAGQPALIWLGQIATPIDRLRRWTAMNCEAAAAMRFMRAPWLARVAGNTVLGDLRYDREVALGFAEIALDEPAADCPSLPPWLAPRGELLR